ncbi:MAG: DUF4388 domain-containing protein [Thermomicrobiales bacterium]|nr:DUF4388 domain-containing protein [Thermomicrobiales bacterium]
MAFMGETAVIGLAELLSVLAARRHTGRLTIISDGEEAQIFLEDGKVILVNSSNHALRLGRILLRLGILSADQLESALRQQDAQGGGRPLGQILLAAKVVAEADLVRAAEEQCIEALTRVMVSKEGSFMFNRDARPRATQGLVALNTDRIVLEASRRADEMVTLRSLLPAPSAQLALSRRQPVGRLSAHEKQVIDVLDWQSGTLGMIAQTVTMDEVSLWRAVVSLRERGLIVAHGTGYVEQADEPGEMVATRAVDEVIRLCSEGVDGVVNRIPSLAEVRSGVPAGSQTTAAVTVVIREVIASFNAGLTMRAFANFTDDHFRRRGPLPEAEIAYLRAPGHPLPAEEQETFLAIHDVRQLPDGRVSAILMTHQPAVGETRKVLIFARAGDRWQIDAVIEAPPAPNATATAMLQSAGALS